VAELPLFLLNTVLFPGGRLTLRVFEKRYFDMVTASLKADRPFGVCLIKRGSEVGTAADPQEVGTFAHIVQCDLEQPGILQVTAKGGSRFRVRGSTQQKDQLVVGEVEPLVEIAGAMPERHARLVEALRHVLEQAGDKSYFPPPQWDDAAWVSGRLVELLPLPLGLKQALLELDDINMRLDVLAEFFPPPAEQAQG
jgi:Lon protease-like protein